MRFSTIISTLSLTAFAAAVPAAAPAPAELQKRECKSTVVEALDSVLLKIVPELKGLLDGVTETEDALGEAVPALGEVLDLLDKLCI